MKKLFVLLLFMTSTVNAQTVIAERVRFMAGPCYVSSLVGPPIQLVLTGNCSAITTSAATNLTLSPTGDLITDPVGNDILPALNYDINIGMLSKKYLTLHAAELWVETLVAQNTIATIGGRVLVAPTNILTLDLAPATTTISVKYNNFNNGDRVYMEANGSLEFMAVTSAASGGGPYTYTVTRNLDGSGANQWYAGDALLDTGTTGNGFIDLYSTAGVLSTGVGPTICGNVRTGTTYNAYGPRWCIGNLNGVYNYGADTYGAAFGDAAATNVTVDATNGFRIRSGTTNKFVADTSGNLSIVGDLSIGTSGVIRSGATGYSTGTGWWMEYNGGTPRFRIGNPAGARLTWDGTTLAITGVDGAGITNIDGGNIQTGTVTATKINVSSLSAISANIGTITAGSISGITATFGGGAVTLDSNGVSITNGSGTVNKVKWSDGSYIYASSGIVAQSSGNWNLQTNGGSAQWTFNSSRLDPPGGADLGSSGSRINIMWLIDTIKWSSPPTTTSNDDPVVYSSGNAQLYRKTNGFNGNCSNPTSIDIDKGIVVGCS